MIIDVIAMHVVHVTIVQVAIMVVMLDSLVTTTFSVFVLMLSVNFTRHLNSPFTE